MKCPKCDLEVKKNFCAKCGHQVSSDYQSKSIAKFLIILGMTVLGLFGLLISAGIVSATYQSFGGGLADLFGFIFLIISVIPSSSLWALSLCFKNFLI